MNCITNGSQKRYRMYENKLRILEQILVDSSSNSGLKLETEFRLFLARLIRIWSNYSDCALFNKKPCTAWRWANSMRVNPSWETLSWAATQEFPNILWNPKVYCRRHKYPPLASAPSELNPVHITSSYLLNIHFNIILSPTSWSS
jgi:hypothetical protein